MGCFPTDKCGTNPSCMEIWKEQMWPLDSYHDPKATAPSASALLYAPGTPRPSVRLEKSRQKKAQVSKLKGTPQLELPKKTGNFEPDTRLDKPLRVSHDKFKPNLKGSTTTFQPDPQTMILRSYVGPIGDHPKYISR